MRIAGRTASSLFYLVFGIESGLRCCSAPTTKERFMQKSLTSGAAAVGVLLTLLFFPALASATTVSFTPSPAAIGVPFQNTNVDLFSTGLNGMTLSGQSLSLDLVLTNDLLARIQLINPGQLGIALTVFTNAGTDPGFAGPTTGFLLNPSGGQLGPTQDAGRAMSSDGSFSMGLVSFSAGLGTPVDISGVHFDTSFPNSGFTVTNSQLRFTLNSNQLTFGTAQQLPETSPLVLLVAGFSLGGLLSRRRSLRS